jgi:threonylcarbamoyladenosine tRNA methylthiotransferase MtaB
MKMKINERIADDVFKLLQLKENGAAFLSGAGTSLNCALVSSGCKLNQFESSQLEAVFKKLNINIIKPKTALSSTGLNQAENIDFFLVNTCAVTEKADNETERIIRKIRRKYPESRLILTGCSAQLNKTKLAEIPNAVLIDNIQKTELLKISAEKFPDSILSQKRSRPYLKIQEGCVLKCSYCIIPKARPVKWSLGIKEVLNSIKEFQNLGYKEVILTGVNIGSYSDEKSGANLKYLLAAIEENHKINLKIRLSSIDPVYIDDDTIKIFADSKKIQNHFHIPVQSASDKILKSMNRNYSFKDYAGIVLKITEKIKDVSIGTDIISGFPGETESDFMETIANINTLPLYYIHAFSYSDRPGTKSYLMKPKTDEKEIKRRTAAILEISSRKKAEFHKKFKNKVLEFLSLPSNKAISSNYIKVKLQSPETVPAGKLLKGRITEIIDESASDGGGVSAAIESYIND